MEDIDREKFISACSAGGNKMAAMLMELNEIWWRRLVADAHRLVRDLGKAEDLAQQCLIKAWTSCARYDGKGKLYSWLTAILVNKCRDMWDHEKVREHLSVAVAEPEEGGETILDRGLAESGDGLKEIEQEEMFKCWQAFREIAPLHALALDLNGDGELDGRQIAERLGKTHDASRQFLLQARRKWEAFVASWHYGSDRGSKS